MLPFGFPAGSIFVARIPTFSNTSPSCNMKRKTTRFKMLYICKIL